MTVKLLTEHQLEFLSLKGGCTGSSESTHIKMLHCWKSRATAQFLYEPRHGKHFFGVPLEKPPTCLQVDTDTSTSLLVFDW